MKDYRFKLEFAVRDYELDSAGMVNNAAYLNYLEHTRHEFLMSRGIDFTALAAEGFYLVVIRIEINYLFPLRSGDRFIVGLNTRRVSRLRLGIDQDIFRLPDHKPVVSAVVTATGLNERGRPQLPKALEALIREAISPITK
jgi:acyl-CoA thioester hydrolase